MAKGNDTKENVIAVSFFAIIVIIIVGFSTNWFGLTTQEMSGGNPVVTTSVNGEPVKGDANAPITIVEFSDFQCPYCGNFYRSTLPSLLEQYVDTGRVKFIYKQFPLTRAHPQAMPAAIATECAFRQDSFWEMHDMIFDNQNRLGQVDFADFAENIGLDVEQFNSCVDAGSARLEVEEDFSEGTRAGVSSTPSFIVGTQEGTTVTGELVVGAQPLTKFVEVIERLS